MKQRSIKEKKQLVLYPKERSIHIFVISLVSLKICDRGHQLHMLPIRTTQQRKAESERMLNIEASLVEYSYTHHEALYYEN